MIKTILIFLSATTIVIGGTPYTIVIEPDPDPDPEPIIVALHDELIAVCACESSYEGGSGGKPQQFEPDGITPRWGRVHPADKGMCQINTAVHQETLDKLGLNVLTEEGNIKFANYLYDNEGLRPWKASKACWSN